MTSRETVRRMYSFRHTDSRVLAIRVGESGIVELPERGTLVCGVGKWIVLCPLGGLCLMSHSDFMRDYEPADDVARSYLEAMTK